MYVFFLMSVKLCVHDKLILKVGHPPPLSFMEIIGYNGTAGKTMMNLVRFAILVQPLLSHLRLNKFFTASLYLLIEY